MKLSFLRDKKFLRALLSLAIPVAFQQFISAGVNMVDVLMVGQLGESAIAALGLANQLFFLLIIFLFGVTSGIAIFSAQYWGKRDIENIHKVLGISLIIASAVGAAFSLAAIFFPETILRFYTEDQEVIALASSYLRIVGVSYIFTAIVTSYFAILRSITLVKMTVVISVIALILKSILGYVLIFGIGIFPELGVRGAAISTAFAWILQFFLTVGLVYFRKTPLAVHPRFFFRFDRAFLDKVLKTAMPAAINEVFWSVGITVYFAVYAHISTSALAAIQINATIEEIAFVLFIGLGNACAIMIGNRIGEGEIEQAYEYSRRFLIMVVLLAIFLGICILFLREPIIGLYEVSSEVAETVNKLLIIFSLALWLRSINFILFVGVLRAGGDTRFAMYMEIFSVWVIGVPAALIGGIILNLPVYGVYLLVLSEEVVKAIIILRRYKSRKWMHNLVDATV
jgi:putative MATE family efflux protein